MHAEHTSAFLRDVLGPNGYFALAVFIVAGVPVIFVVQLLVLLFRKIAHRPLWGLLLGSEVAFWGSLSWLIVPYCGAYPNLPWLIVMSTFPAKMDPAMKELFIHGMNVIVWPTGGWLVGLMSSSSHREDP